MDNGPPVQTLSRRDFLYPDADEKYVPAVLAYIHDTDVGTLNTLLYTRTPARTLDENPFNLVERLLDAPLSLVLPFAVAIKALKQGN
jgi:hypothetical protein